MIQTERLSELKHKEAGIVINPAQVNNKGTFYYAWQSGDTDTLGRYDLEFEATPASGGKFTIPVTANAVVYIVADIDET